MKNYEYNFLSVLRSNIGWSICALQKNLAAFCHTGYPISKCIFWSPFRICNYDIFINWDWAAWSKGSKFWVLLLEFYFINVTWPPQPLILINGLYDQLVFCHRWVIWCNINLIFCIHLFSANTFWIPIKKYRFHVTLIKWIPNNKTQMVDPCLGTMQLTRISKIS